MCVTISSESPNESESKKIVSVVHWHKNYFAVSVVERSTCFEFSSPLAHSMQCLAATASSINSYCLRSGLDLVKIQTEDNAHPAADYYLPSRAVCLTKSYAFAFGVHFQ